MYIYICKYIYMYIYICIYIYIHLPLLYIYWKFKDILKYDEAQ